MHYLILFLCAGYQFASSKFIIENSSPISKQMRIFTVDFLLKPVLTMVFRQPDVGNIFFMESN